MTAPADPDKAIATPHPRLARLVPLAVVVLVSIGLIVIARHEGLTPVALLERRMAIDTFVNAHRFAALAAFALVYALSVALSMPGAALLTICGGIIFGGFEGGLASLIGATAGATLIFLIAKSALGGWLIRRAGQRAEVLAAGFCDDAFHYLLFLRLVPVFPFWLVNLVPALCGVRVATFVATTALGIIPGTFAFAFFGAGVHSAIMGEVAAYHACVTAGHADCKLGFDVSAAATPQLIAGLIALGVLSLAPVVIKRLRARRTPAGLSS